ncbi:RagB/SusD family nutrient uptake outer membrane protein [Pedobacter agri]|uniref:RagB/SusD family nutrient uptake outer membrane protein n=1 Tax=Pedobacter agri TaxID=454586 RepID=UPI00292FC303|nr:RagB/SusD family nutrient uptake outer membrane protein [Pedobacter agri]
MKKYYIIFMLFIFVVACKKQDKFLDIKSKKSDVILGTLQDYQALLDNTDIMNNSYPSIGMIGSDNYFVTSASWQASINPTDRNSYIWASDIYENSTTIATPEWSTSFQIIEYANIVLEGIEKIAQTVANQNDYNNIKGSALFFRSFSFYNLSQLFAKPYDPTTSSTDLGLPLRKTSNVNAMVQRATVKETYSQIIDDLKQAEILLPMNPAFKSRPSKIAAQALLAKVYLIMLDYENAKKYADLALSQNSTLIDFNTLTTTRTYSFGNFTVGNPEVIIYMRATLTPFMISPTQIVAPELYNLYNSNDLRRSIFYRSNAAGIIFTGKYTGNVSFFSGLATNEIYLIRSECLARTGNAALALADLNTLLIKRWNKNVTYSPVMTNSLDEALAIILQERRKELPFTSNTRWEDLRRFNKDSRFAVTLSRIVNSITYSLPPNDPRYIYPIPPLEIEKSGLQQNLR